MRRPSVFSLAAVAALAALLALGSLTYSQSLDRLLGDTARRGENTLTLAELALRGQMERFERLPELIADDPLVKAIATDPLNLITADAANRYLQTIQTLLGASDIYFMDATGITRAASNFDAEKPFIGGNFAFRPYFRDAINGGEGRFYALGTTSGKRGYYFGAPVRVAGDIRGVLVVKIDLDLVEKAWRGADYQVLVTDPEGVVFLSSNPGWRFTALTPLTQTQRAALSLHRRYADLPLPALPVAASHQQAGQHLLTLTESGTTHEYLMVERPVREADWTIRVMLNTAAARTQALSLAFVVMLGLGLAAMAGAVVLQRRAALRDSLRLQLAARAQLEQRVTERTRELAKVNATLEGEVAERILAEDNLRRAQSDLVQAGKLAALGQMSAALSHEINQPLGAARTYADNALVLMDRDRLPEARHNLTRILSLIDRMSSISGHLRSFARAPHQKLRAVDVAEVVEAAIEITNPRLRAARVDLTVDLPPDLPHVQGGPVRLQQVLVNLLTNAADAVEGTANRHIAITARATPTGLRISVRDHGPGVAPGLPDRIFDPFFSTKGVGKGLGLGLSISYNIIRDFGGNLSHGTPDDGAGQGAEFIIDLRTAIPENAPEIAPENAPENAAPQTTTQPEQAA
ncbi:two-component system, NtrC family, C4-dicarboxylate transport sensor histidine kinase DctB [Pseudorhodobacter antarcticus]|uniref:C4-dicarboxylate transport sensor protein DctB n=1 Tax=Pseudorhodobacter antarcticus TaxID=1077947 RepID=A0A1H8MYW6_9RHOB|nr:ATP-binding protein [Pseudorhodobacter antarcticus]SEO22585.1 two-component system, NtrC family, C4-dicarboxylate transport sensor histidine kinase DctB [Pseudorhodobacter antarcticus]